MNTQTPFSLAVGHFAQPAVDSKSLAINGQNLIDAFADLDMDRCEKMAALLAQNKDVEFARMFKNMMRDWSGA